MRNFLIRIILKIIDGQIFAEENKPAVEEWLYLTHLNQGFQNFIAVENLRLLKQGMDTAQTHEKYLEIMGQRLFLKKLAYRAKQAYNARVKGINKVIEADKRETAENIDISQPS